MSARDAARQALRDAALGAARDALRAVDAQDAVARALRGEAGERLGDARRLVVLGWGKAGVPMLRGAVSALAERGRRIDGGLVVVKDGFAEGLTGLAGVRVASSAHPVPDARGPALADEMLALAATLREGDMALVLSSGGGSSLLASPPEGVSLQDLSALLSRLLASGAGIAEMNVVRRHLSRVHGGRLARALGDASSVALLVSDVPGDDPADIASGPTAADPTTWRDVESVLARFAPDAPASVRALVARGVRGETGETPKDVDRARHAQAVVASALGACAAARASLEARGFAVIDLGPALAGDAAAVASALAGRLGDALSRSPRAALVAAGETSVVVRGDAPGGRNQHLAACLARELAGSGVACAAACIATDGDDGSTGAAGAVVDDTTWARAAALGLEPAAMLQRCEAHALLRATGDVVVTGPTRTNVMDLAIVLAERDAP